MSEVQFDCPHCGLTLAIEAVYAGQESTCPTCSGAFIIPALAVAPPPGPTYSGAGYTAPGYAAPPASSQPAAPRRPQPIPGAAASPANTTQPQSAAPRRPQPLASPIPLTPGSAAPAPPPAPPGGAHAAAQLPRATMPGSAAPGHNRQGSPGTVTIPDPQGGSYVVREPVKTIRAASGEVIELRRLTPEEKAARRFRRNLIMMLFGLVVLILVVAILMNVRF